MYCKNCGFHSFDHLKNCPKCDHEWEQTRKDLGVQWIEETKGNWLRNVEKAESRVDAAGEKTTAIPDDSFLHASQDDFMFEKDWPIITSNTQEHPFSQKEEFVFAEEVPSPARQKEKAAEYPASALKLEPRTLKEGAERDLLIPGLEKMLQAEGARHPQHLQHKADAPKGTITLAGKGKKAATSKADNKTFSPLPMPTITLETNTSSDAVHTKKDAELDIVEINLDDLQLSSDEATKACPKD
jgi:hypothetical protein